MYSDFYFVNKEKGVVVCVLRNCEGDAFLDFSQRFYNEHERYMTPVNQKYFINSTYRGIAKCDFSEDEFNETFGKDLAFQRARNKYLRAKAKMIRRICNDMTQKIENNINPYLENLDKTIDKSDKLLEVK